jgi:hypothetical protein
MAVNQPPGGHPLPCGRTLEDLWDHLQTGTPDAHERTCTHCRTATSGLEALAAAVTALRSDTAEPPADLITQIMHAVRAETRRGHTLELIAGPSPVAVSEQAAAVVLRYAADTVDGVRARRCLLHQPPGQPGTVRVEMSLALRYGTGPAAAVVDQVRRRVIAAAQASIGLHVTAVDLHLEDLWPLTGPGSGGSAGTGPAHGGSGPARHDGVEHR